MEGARYYYATMKDDEVRRIRRMHKICSLIMIIMVIIRVGTLFGKSSRQLLELSVLISYGGCTVLYATMKDDEESNVKVLWRNAETCVELRT